MKIYVDAMGGDLAPEAPVKGALRALRQYPHLMIILAGKLDEVKPFLRILFSCFSSFRFFAKNRGD